MVKNFIIFFTSIIVTTIFFTCNVKAYSDGKYIEFNYESQFFNDYITNQVRDKAKQINNIVADYCSRNSLYYTFSLSYSNATVNAEFYIFEDKYDYFISNFFRGGYTSGLFLNSYNSFNYRQVSITNIFAIDEVTLNNSLDSGTLNRKQTTIDKTISIVKYDPFNNFSETRLPFSAYDYNSSLHDLTSMYLNTFLYASNFKLKLASMDDQYFVPIKSNGKILKIGDSLTTFTNSNDIEVNYKMSFNSGESAEDMKKVVVTFFESENTNSMSNGKIKFRLQFGSNDFSDTNIPIFSHYKIYGKKRVSSTTWEEVPETILDDDGTIYEHKITDIKNSYDYVPGKLADASIEMIFNIPTKLCIYEVFMIEFYFDNTENYFINLFDSLDKSTWTEVPNFLADYTFYYFPPHYRYAFVSSKNVENEGKIYFPTNHYNNSAVRLKGLLYDYSINAIKSGEAFKPILYEDDDYYSYFDFKFSYNDKNILALSRKAASKYYSYYDPDFLSNMFKLFPDRELITNSEMSYFYAPSGYSISFATPTDDKVSINTPNGWIDEDMNLTYDDNDYTELESYDTLDNVFKKVDTFVESVKENINQLSKLVEFTYKSLNPYVQDLMIVTFIVIMVVAIILWLK